MLMKTCNVSYFSSKKNLQLYRKWQTFKLKIWQFFTTQKKKKKKKKRRVFLTTHLLIMFVEKYNFLQEYIEAELKHFS